MSDVLLKSVEWLDIHCTDFAALASLARFMLAAGVLICTVPDRKMLSLAVADVAQSG
jgi:hypothetical protein